MRKYATFSPRLYTGKLGRAIKGRFDLQALAAYLIGGPHTNMLGFYRLPVGYIIADIGMPPEGYPTPPSKGTPPPLRRGLRPRT